MSVYVRLEVDHEQLAVELYDIEGGFLSAASIPLKKLGQLIASAMEEAWRDMETAPRDGTHILADCQSGGIREVWYVRDRYHGEEHWRDAANSDPIPLRWKPTSSGS